MNFWNRVENLLVHLEQFFGIGQTVIEPAKPAVIAPPVVKPGDAIDPGKPTVTDLLYRADPATAAILNSRIGQSSSDGPSVFDDGVVRYNHHTFAHGVTSSLTTEPLQGKTRVSFTYTSQDEGKTGPSQIWLSENGGPQQGPMQAGVEATFDLAATAGVVGLSYRSDTNGRTIAQLFKV